MDIYPTNHRAKWSDTEMMKLLSEVNKKTPFQTIADNHHRTIGAIKYKLIRYAIDEMKSSETVFSMNYLIKLTNLSKEELLEGFKKLNFIYENDENDESVDVNDNHQELIVERLDKIHSNLLLIWGCLFAYNLIQFIVHFKTLTGC